MSIFFERKMRITNTQKIELIVLTVASFAISFFGLNYCSIAKELFTAEGIRLLPYSIATATVTAQIILKKFFTLKSLTY